MPELEIGLANPLFYKKGEYAGLSERDYNLQLPNVTPWDQVGPALTRVVSRHSLPLDQRLVVLIPYMTFKSEPPSAYYHLVFPDQTPADVQKAICDELKQALAGK
jgi:hypothetical protein